MKLATKRLLLGVLTLFLSLYSLHSYSQSKFNFSFGLGVNYCDYSEDIEIVSDFPIPDIDKAVFLPSIQSRISYMLDDKWRISLGPSLNWKGANQVFGQNNYRGLFLDLPLLAHFQIARRISVMAGPVYSQNLRLTSDFPTGQLSEGKKGTRNIVMAGSIGLAYRISPKFDFNLSFNTDVDETINFRFVDDYGMSIANISLRNQFVQLAFIFKK